MRQLHIRHIKPWLPPVAFLWLESERGCGVADEHYSTGHHHAILTAASSPAPSLSGATTVHQLARANTVRAYITYNGTVNACAIRLWLYDGANWYEGPSTDDLDPLTPGGASPVNESRDWEIGEGQKFTFQLESISGGGTAAVSAEGAV